MRRGNTTTRTKSSGEATDAWAKILEANDAYFQKLGEQLGYAVTEEGRLKLAVSGVKQAGIDASENERSVLIGTGRKMAAEAKTAVSEKAHDVKDSIKSKAERIMDGNTPYLTNKLQPEMLYQAMYNLKNELQSIDRTLSGRLSNPGLLDVYDLTSRVREMQNALLAIEKDHLFNERYDDEYHAKLKNNYPHNVFKNYREFRKEFVELLLKMINSAELQSHPQLAEIKKMVHEWQAEIQKHEVHLTFLTHSYEFNRIHKGRMFKKVKPEKSMEEETAINKNEAAIPVSTSSSSSMSFGHGEHRRRVKEKLTEKKEKIGQKASDVKEKTSEQVHEKKHLVYTKKKQLKRSVIGKAAYIEGIWDLFLNALKALEKNVTEETQRAFLESAKTVVYSSDDPVFLKNFAEQMKGFIAFLQAIPENKGKMSAQLGPFPSSIETQIGFISELHHLQKAKKAYLKKESNIPFAIAHPDTARSLDQHIQGYQALSEKNQPKMMSTDERLDIMQTVVAGLFEPRGEGLKLAKTGIIAVNKLEKHTPKQTMLDYAVVGFKQLLKVIPVGKQLKNLSENVSATLPFIGEDFEKGIANPATIVAAKLKKKLGADAAQTFKKRANAYLAMFYSGNFGEKEYNQIARAFVEKLYQQFPFAIDGVLVTSSQKSYIESIAFELFKYVFDHLHEFWDNNKFLQNMVKSYKLGQPGGIPQNMLDRMTDAMVESLVQSANSKALTLTHGVMYDGYSVDHESLHLTKLYCSAGIVTEAKDGSLQFYAPKDTQPDKYGFRQLPKGKTKVGIEAREVNLHDKAKSGFALTESEHGVALLDALEGKKKTIESRYKDYSTKCKNRAQHQSQPVVPTTSTLSSNPITTTTTADTAMITQTSTATANTSMTSPATTPTMTTTNTSVSQALPPTTTKASEGLQLAQLMQMMLAMQQRQQQQDQEIAAAKKAAAEAQQEVIALRAEAAKLRAEKQEKQEKQSKAQQQQTAQPSARSFLMSRARGAQQPPSSPRSDQPEEEKQSEQKNKLDKS